MQVLYSYTYIYTRQTSFLITVSIYIMSYQRVCAFYGLVTQQLVAAEQVAAVAFPFEKRHVLFEKSVRWKTVTNICPGVRYLILFRNMQHLGGIRP